MRKKVTNTLNKVRMNVRCSVSYIDKLNTAQIDRMYDLGIVKGAEITPIHKSMFGNTRVYLVKGSAIALRATDASKIVVVY